MPGDSTRLKRYFERIATVDPLTGLRNRRWMDDAFARQLERTTRAKQSVSVLLVEVDDLKRANRDYGHEQGRNGIST